MFMLKGVIIFAFVLLSGVSSAKTLEFKKQCGEHKYIITIDHPDPYYEAIIKHYYQEGDAKKELFHQSTEGMHVSASCTKDKNNSDVFIFTEICGGSGCIEDIYGLYDLKQKKLLLKPSDWPKGNEKEVIQILGKPDFLVSKSNFYHFKDYEFCCVDQIAERQSTRFRQ